MKKLNDFTSADRLQKRELSSNNSSLFDFPGMQREVGARNE